MDISIRGREEATTWKTTRTVWEVSSLIQSREDKESLHCMYHFGKKIIWCVIQWSLTKHYFLFTKNFRDIVRSLWNLTRNLTEGKLVKFEEKVRGELYKIEIKSNDFVHDDHNFVFNYLGKNQIDEWAKTIWKSFLTHALNCLLSSTGSELGKGNGSNGRKWFLLSWYYYHHPIYVYAYLSCTCYVEEAW